MEDKLKPRVVKIPITLYRHLIDFAARDGRPLAVVVARCLDGKEFVALMVTGHNNPPIEYIPKEPRKVMGINLTDASWDKVRTLADNSNLSMHRVIADILAFRLAQPTLEEICEKLGTRK